CLVSRGNSSSSLPRSPSPRPSADKLAAEFVFPCLVRASRTRVDPSDLRIGPEPRQLSLRELARRSERSLPRLVEPVGAVEMCPELAIADGAQCRMSRRELRSRAQALDFREKALLHPLREPAREAFVKHAAIGRRECPARERCLERTARRALQRRERQARDEADLERALNALRVVRMNACSCLGIEPRELCVQTRPAFHCRARIDLAAQLQGAAGKLGYAAHECAQVEHRSTDEER